MPLRSHIDYPPTWSFKSQWGELRGWCFTTDGQPVTGIRLICSDRCLAGVVNLPRPDVKRAIPEAPNEHVGFEIRGLLPSGRHQARIEARLTNGEWALASTHHIIAPRRVRPLWLGGGTWSELMHLQVPTHALYSPRPVRLERFPAKTASSIPPLKISIVTPALNHVRYLPETMRSVLDQAGCRIEYIVQDGGSTDGSVAIIQKSASRLHAWASSPDRGQADAIAKGFATTSGEPEDLMAWINSDDFYLPGALSYVTEYFDQHPEVDVVYGHRIVVNENSNEIARWFVPQYDSEVLRYYDFVPQETLFWRRRIWEKAGGIDRTFQFALDWDLILRFQAAGARFARLPRFLGCFRIHTAQKTSAQIQSIGESEIRRLRMRTFGRDLAPSELVQNSRLHSYLRRSAMIELLWKCGLRAA